MEEKELLKAEGIKDDIKKCIGKIYNTTSIVQESNATEEIIKLIGKLDKEAMISLANEVDIFGKCILYYKLPIEYRMNVEFINAAKTVEGDRLLYWKEYKEKVRGQKLNQEEEYNKFIMMACILHVPLEDDKVEEELRITREKADNQ